MSSPYSSSKRSVFLALLNLFRQVRSCCLYGPSAFCRILGLNCCLRRKCLCTLSWWFSFSHVAVSFTGMWSLTESAHSSSTFPGDALIFFVNMKSVVLQPLAVLQKGVCDALIAQLCRRAIFGFWLPPSFPCESLFVRRSFMSPTSIALFLESFLRLYSTFASSVTLAFGLMYITLVTTSWSPAETYCTRFVS